MKKTSPLIYKFATLCCPVMLVLGGNSALAVADRVIATFDADIAVSHDDGGAPKSLAWSPENASGSGSGSIYATVNWANAAGWQDSKVGITDSGGTDFAWPGIDCRPYANLEFDVKVDATNSFPSTDGNYGLCQVVFQGWAGANGNPSGIDWSPQAVITINNTNGWQHKVVSLSAYPYNLNKLVLNFAVNPGTNTIAYFVDNIVLTAPPSPPPTLSIAPGPKGGFTAIASKAGDTYQRQIMHTLQSGYSWNTASATSNTTSYSFTIADFPAHPYDGFIAQMFLVPLFVGGETGPNNMQYGANDSSIDWNSGNVIYFTVQQNADGSAAAEWRYKTNTFGGQTMAFNDFTTNGPVGHLGHLVCSTGPLGKWSVSFNNNTNVTITAPNNASTNFTLTADVADVFKDPLYMYIGVQPNDNSRIGQSATFSEISVTGASIPLDDTFTNAGPPYALDPAVWAKSAADGSGLIVTPPDSKFWLSWTTPDPGFTNILVTDDLSKSIANDQWMDLGIPQSSWVNSNNRRVVVVPQSLLDAALPGANRAFFGLHKLDQ